MLGIPGGTGGADSKAESRADRHDAKYRYHNPSAWTEIWWAIQGLFRLPGRIMRALRRR